MQACVAAWLTPQTPDLEVRGSSLARRVVSLDEELYSTSSLFTQVPVVQKLDTAIHWINHYPVDKYQGNKLCYPVDSITHLLNNWDQVYKWVPAHNAGGYPCDGVASHPGGSNNTPRCFILMKLG